MSRYNRRTYSRFIDVFEFNVEYKNRYGFQPYVMIDRLMKNSLLTHTEAFSIVNEQMGAIWKEQRERARQEAQHAVFHDAGKTPFDSEEYSLYRSEPVSVNLNPVMKNSLSSDFDSAWEQLEFIL